LIGAPLAVAFLAPVGAFLLYRDLSSGMAWIPRARRSVHRTNAPVLFWMVQSFNGLLLVGGLAAFGHLLGWF
jgi:hypothetical protein